MTKRTKNKTGSRRSASGKAAPRATAAVKARRRSGTTSRRKAAEGQETARGARGSAGGHAVKSATSVNKKVKDSRRTTSKKATHRKGAKKRVRSRKTSATARSPATTHDPIQFPEEARPLPKTRLTAKTLGEFKRLLLLKRTELCGDVEMLTNEALNSNRGGRGDASAMPIHMADLGSDNWEQEFTLGLIANEQILVREIDEALDRIEARTYGVCLATRRPIGKARLRARPWAKYCIQHARAREEGRAP